MRFRYTQDTDSVDGYEIVSVHYHNGCPVTFTLQDVFIPFGLNYDKSIKFDVLDSECSRNNGIANIEHLEKEAVGKIQDLLCKDESLTKSFSFLKKKGKFALNLIGHVQYSPNGQLVTTITKKTGLPPSVTELKGFQAKVKLSFKSFWVKNKKVYGKLKIEEVNVL